jgi:hypothetical protein
VGYYPPHYPHPKGKDHNMDPLWIIIVLLLLILIGVWLRR